MAIAVAFVAVTLVSGVVYADEKNGKPFEAIWDAIYNLESTPGPQGATGPAGADGTNGITNVYTEPNPVSIPGETTTVKATCNGGDKVLGGGYDLLPTGVTVIADKPDGDNGWLGMFKTDSGTGKTVTVEARCLTVTP